MTWGRSTFIMCEGPDWSASAREHDCMNVYETLGTLADCRKEAKDHGWRFQGGADICPKCWENGFRVVR